MLCESTNLAIVPGDQQMPEYTWSPPRFLAQQNLRSQTLPRRQGYVGLGKNIDRAKMPKESNDHFCVF